ncbi:MAG: DNA mismatch repair protein MutS, partial [Verrucomicrobiota bacterium]
ATYDGLSIAWSVVEHLHDVVGCRTLFATHYHELTQLADSREAVNNYNIAVREWNDQIIFLRQIVPGAADKSYGIQVARLAGLPDSIIGRAKEILASLEGDPAALESAPPPKRPAKAKDESGEDDPQMMLFG